ncbi:MAG: hypothetical protein ABFS30_02325, partial [Pseudomonadota bacterium]
NEALQKEIEAATEAVGTGALKGLAGWDALIATYAGDELITQVREKELRRPLFTTSLSGTKIPKIALPRFMHAAVALAFSLNRAALADFCETWYGQETARAA